MTARAKKICLYVTAVLMVLWLLVIFSLSAKSATVSSSQSGFITGLIRKLHLEWLVPETIKGGSLSANVRKLAHMTEYCILEFLIFFFIYQVPRRWICRWKRAMTASLASFPAAFISACLDEWHQTFVDGRAGLFSDVLIDSRGILAGFIVSLLFLALLYLYRYRKYGSWEFLGTN